MEPGKIRLINTGTGGQGEAGFTQTIALAINNRLYRVTNDGSGDGAPGLMRIRITRSVLWWNINSVFDLEFGRSVDVYGHTLTVVALTTLQLFGTYDTI
jgi:hypothetical protein